MAGERTRASAATRLEAEIAWSVHKIMRERPTPAEARARATVAVMVAIDRVAPLSANARRPLARRTDMV